MIPNRPMKIHEGFLESEIKNGKKKTKEKTLTLEFNFMKQQKHKSRSCSHIPENNIPTQYSTSENSA